MLTLATLRLGLIVVAAVAGLAGLYILFDAVGDLREAKVMAKINAAIAITNKATGDANETDEETLAVAEKLRLVALATAMKMPRATQCELTADEAATLGRVH